MSGMHNTGPGGEEGPLVLENTPEVRRRTVALTECPECQIYSYLYQVTQWPPLSPISME